MSEESVMGELTDSYHWSYKCDRCDVWGRIHPNDHRKCWCCGKSDRLKRL